MKKFFATAIFALSILILQIHQVEAQEVYAYTEARRNYAIDHYVLTHTVQETYYGFKVQMHAIGVKNDSSNKYWEVGFLIENGNLYLVLTPSNPSLSTTQVTSGNSVLNQNYFNIFKILYESGALNSVLR